MTNESNPENDITVIEQTPWPAKGITQYNGIDSGEWGYLILYSDLTFSFDPSRRPPDQDIIARWGNYFKK